jgi:hypothetical protein
MLGIIDYLYQSPNLTLTQYIWKFIGLLGTIYLNKHPRPPLHILQVILHRIDDLILRGFGDVFLPDLFQDVLLDVPLFNILWTKFRKTKKEMPQVTFVRLPSVIYPNQSDLGLYDLLLLPAAALKSLADA